MAILKNLRAGTSDRIRLAREGLQVRVIEIRGGRAKVAIEPLDQDHGEETITTQAPISTRGGGA